MDVRSDKREVMLHLLENARLPERERDSFFERAVSADYWRELNPQLSVCGRLTSDVFEQTPVDDEQERKLLEKLNVEGYFQLNSLLSTEMTSRMLECVDVLRRSGWPPVFAFVYDEFHLVWRAPSLSRLLSAVLGKGYREIPHHIWCHYVPAHTRSGGWAPHVDGYPGRMTVWIALSPATLENGCMYLVPKNLTPERVASEYGKIEAFTLRELETLLQSTRALPVDAGSVLGWNDTVIHWGSRCVDPKEPRVSISLEVASQNPESAVEREGHGHDALNVRLKAIGRALLSYSRFEPLMTRYSDLAERLRDIEV